jgi:DNA-binding NarL/FixJ family response regulator
MNTPIRVLLVEDHASFRQALAFMLDREPDIAVVANVGTVEEARSLLTDIDVGLFDLDLPDGSGLTLVGALHAVAPDAQAVLLTASNERQDLAAAVEAGAVGILHKSVRVAEIIAAIRRIGAGEALLSPREMRELLREAGQFREQSREAQHLLGQLTRREQEVMQALAEGLSDREIADRLHISAETVRTHMGNILGKLRVESRLQALVFAVRYGALVIE